LRAQTPRTTPPPPLTNGSDPAKSGEPPLKKIVLAASAGAAAGALAGTRAISFSALPPSERGPHEWRSGLVYGAIGGALTGAVATRVFAGPDPDPRAFWWNKWNTPLLAGIVTVHALDFASTRYFRDRGKDEWLLTNSIVDHRAGFVATEAAAAAAGIGLMYILHRTGHDRLERWVAAGYIALGTASAIANYRYPSTGHAIFGH
jgi:hypothetical protein